ncbi:hypothetical protein TRFO_09914 [Tritrichomonas foetus]|uniref:Uncharacterized protein n=1 Tax=Tritrichomonas foetus TaxID=1144522 RepID=A0A1J4JBG6_9EUKA|nr:hypothetical protein TRFO_09914 [Tritrichomonas foetus]|eukprot:OHS96526.1 hypothetical protein TRFO_09914 [Tritrichomonas foetus]
MCQCCRDASSLDIVDKSKIETCSKDIISLLKNDVYIVIFQQDNHENLKYRWKSIYSYSTPSMASLSHDTENIASSILSTEDAIRQLNIGLRVDDLVSYNLSCHSSKIYTHILDTPAGSLRLVIINKAAESEEVADDPDVNNRLKKISHSIKRALSASPSTHNTK